MNQIFIIHGWTYSLDKYEALQNSLRDRQLEPIMLKVPGLTEPSDKVWDIDGYTTWLDQQLKDVERPVVVGHSNGGRIALAYAQKYPGRLGQLILIDSAGIAHSERRSLLKLAVLRLLAKVGSVLAFVPHLKEIFYKAIGARDYYEAPENMKQTMQNMLHADQKLDFTKVHLPVTIIWGQDDTITPLSDGKQLQTRLAGSNLHVIEGACHSPHASNSAEVADIIAECVKEPK